MPISNFPVALQGIIQQDMLAREFEESLHARLGFDSIADVESFAIRAGETVTKTRAGLLATPTTALNPATNGNFDNGMTPNAGWAVEQYTMTLAEWGDTLDLNVVGDKVGIASRFLQNARAQGEQSRRKRDELARDALYAVYLGGNTRVVTTLGAAGATVAVDDVRGFSSGLVTVGNSSYTLVSVAVDGTNVSTAPGGVSGSLTFSTNVTVANGTAGKAIVAATAPYVIRPNGRLTTAALVAGDTLSMVDSVMEAAAIMRDNAVPEIDGCYHAYLDNRTMKSLFKDGEFQLLFRGTGLKGEYRTGEIVEVGGVRFIPTNMAPQQTLGSLQVKRTLVVGRGALVRGDFAGQDAADAGNGSLVKTKHDGITYVVRPPMDRLGEMVSQSWKWIGGFVAPTDLTANSSVIPTATNSAYKRGIVIESSAN